MEQDIKPHPGCESARHAEQDVAARSGRSPKKSTGDFIKNAGGKVRGNSSMQITVRPFQPERATFHTVAAAALGRKIRGGVLMMAVTCSLSFAAVHFHIREFDTALKLVCTCAH